MARDPEQTDELRRLALQLALQLPASVADARKVLALTGECLDDFLIEAEGPASARARRLWRLPRPMLVNSAPLPQRTSRLAVFLCCLGVLALSGCLGAIAIRTIGYGAAGLNLLAITVISMLFGRGAALASVGLAYLLTTWAVMPPSWDISWPTVYELCGVGLYGLAAVLIPWIQEQREPLREATLRAASRPLSVFLRKAA